MSAVMNWRSSPRDAGGQERQFVLAAGSPQTGVPLRAMAAVRNASLADGSTA
jgi:hypothetical protein